MGLNVYGGLVYPMVSVVADPLGSLWNIYPAPNLAYPDAPTRFMFGVVDGVNYLGTRLVYGQRVMFDSAQAILVTQAEVAYYIMDENSAVSFIENPLPVL